MLEMIVVLVLMGILAAGAGLFLITGVQAYLFSSKNSAATLKVNNALERLTLELRDTSYFPPAPAGVAGAIIYDIVDTNTTGASATQRKTVTAAAGVLTISGYNPYTLTSLGGSMSLLDNVQNFSLNVACADLDPSRLGNEVQSIDISLTTEGIPAFTTKVYPRNLVGCPY